MTRSHTPEQIVAGLRSLYVAVVADVLDRLGFRSQVMDHRIRPVTPHCAIAGRAFTVQAAPNSVIDDNPYENSIAAVDAITDGTVVVVATDGCYEAAIWGELLCTRATARGATGAVIDGAVRDVSGLIDLGSPTFAAAVNANDSRGRLKVTSYGSRVTCGGVEVSASDYVLGDLDGVVVVPKIAAVEVLAEADAKQAKEALVRELLSDGASVEEVYAWHGVL